MVECIKSKRLEEWQKGKKEFYSELPKLDSWDCRGCDEKFKTWHELERHQETCEKFKQYREDTKGYRKWARPW